MVYENMECFQIPSQFSTFSRLHKMHSIFLLMYKQDSTTTEQKYKINLQSEISHLHKYSDHYG